MQTGLTGIIHRERVKIQTGIVADDPVRILSVEFRFEDGVFLRGSAVFLRFSGDADVVEGDQFRVILMKQFLKPLHFGGIGGADQNFHDLFSLCVNSRVLMIRVLIPRTMAAAAVQIRG